MSTMSITIDDQRVVAALERLQRAATDLTPAMRAITQALLLEVEQNFESQGRPRWAPLAESTKLARLGGGRAYKKDGTFTARAQRTYDGLRILQASGQLAASVQTRYGATEAVIGSNKVYAAIHQFGGQAGRNKSVTLVARPWLPLTEDKALQPHAVAGVLETVLAHLQSAI